MTPSIHPPRLAALALALAASLAAALLAPGAARAADGEKRKVKRADREWLVLREKPEGWRATSAGATLEVSRSGGTLDLRGRGSWRAQRTGDAVRITGPGGKPWATVDAGAEKTRIAFEGGRRPPLTIKRKDAEKLKVTVGDREAGKIKLYADKGKVKAKAEAGDEELCETKGDRLLPSLAVCFVPDLPEEELLVLFTVLELEHR
jgi:hypothetical protein